MTTQTRGWPPSRRKAQAERIRRQKPWLHATGPRTLAGRHRASLNAIKHHMRSAPMLRLRRALARQRWFLRFGIIDKAQRPSSPLPWGEVVRLGEHRERSRNWVRGYER